MEKEIKIYNHYTKEVAHVSPTYADAMKWIAAAAQELNFGIYRIWTEDGYEMYDVGPCVYAIEVAKIKSKTSCQNQKS